MNETPAKQPEWALSGGFVHFSLQAYPAWQLIRELLREFRQICLVESEVRRDHSAILVLDHRF